MLIHFILKGPFEEDKHNVIKKQGNWVANTSEMTDVLTKNFKEK